MDTFKCESAMSGSGINLHQLSVTCEGINTEHWLTPYVKSGAYLKGGNHTLTLLHLCGSHIHVVTSNLHECFNASEHAAQP